MKRIIALVFITALISACTSTGDSQAAIATGVAQTQQVSQLSTSAALGAATPTPTLAPPTEQPTATPLPEFYWNGNWQVWFSTGVTAHISIDHYGYLIYSVDPIVSGTESFLLYGVLDESMQVATGTFYYVPATSLPTAIPPFTFEMHMLSDNHDQFTGSVTLLGVNYGVCGARNGAAKPASC